MKIKVFNFFHKLYEEGEIPFKTIQADAVETPSKDDCVVFEDIIREGKEKGLFICSDKLFVTSVTRKYGCLKNKYSEKIEIAIDCSQTNNDSLENQYSFNRPNVRLEEWCESNKLRMSVRLYKILTSEELIRNHDWDFVEDINKAKFKKIRGLGNMAWVEFEKLRKNGNHE